MSSGDRADEPDNLLELHKSFIETHASANDALKEAVLQSRTAMRQNEDHAMHVGRTVQTQILDKLGAAEGAVKRLLDRLSQQVEETVGSMLGVFSTATGTALEDVDNLTRVSTSANCIREFSNRYRMYTKPANNLQS